MAGIRPAKTKEIVKKPFYKGDPMIWSETKKKWFVISKIWRMVRICRQTIHN